MTRKPRSTRLHLLTPREIVAAQDGDHGDGGGLVLRISTKTNSSSWVFRYTAPSGKRREAGLGRAERANPKQAGESVVSAREAASAARELLKQGIDPLEAREAKRLAEQQAEQARKAAAQAERWTLCRCARDYHERVIAKHRTAKHAAQWLSSLENHLPARVWHKPIAEVDHVELLEALQSVTPHERARRAGGLEETVRRLRQRLDAVYEDAIFHKRATVNAAALIRRKLAETDTKKAKRENKRSLSAIPYPLAPRLMARIAAAPGTAARCLEFTVLCAARTSEALLAEWSEFDLESGLWVVPGERMKTGEPHTVYLSPRAIQILRGQMGHDSVMVFPSTQKGREGLPMSNMSMLTVLGRLGVRGQTTVHGMARQTFSTWANELNIARSDAIEACLAHKEANLVKAAYNKAQFANERRALLEEWSKYLAADNVVQLKAA